MTFKKHFNRFSSFLLALGFTLPSVHGQELYVVDPMESIYADARPSPLGGTILSSGVGGEMILQIAYFPRNLEERYPSLSLEDESGATIEAEWFKLSFVPVEQNTALSHGTVKRDPRNNPFIIRKAPFDMADVMIPFGSDEGGLLARGTEELPEGLKREYYAVRWLIEETITRGLQTLVVRAVDASGKETTTHFQLEVAPVRIPPASQGSFRLTQTSSLSAIAKYHNLELWSEEFWEMYKKYAEMLVQGRQNTARLLFADLARGCPTGEEPEFSERLRRNIQVCLEAGMRDFTGVGLLYGILPRSDTTNPRMGVLHYSDYMLNTPKGDAKFHALLDQINEVVVENDLHDRFRMQVFDEVPEHFNNLYGQAAATIRARIPGVKIYEVINSPNLGIAEHVDEWIPMPNVYMAQREFFEARKREGADVGFYVCTGPGGAWINRLLDQERVRIALTPWFAHGYGFSTFLHWGANSWLANPFEQSAVFVGYGDRETNFLPAGDTHILYPGPGGPWPSLRHEVQRLGIEDYEVLRKISKNDETFSRQLVFEHFPLMNDHPRDGASYWKARRTLLSAASSLAD